MIDMIMTTAVAITETASTATEPAIQATEGGIIADLSNFFADFDGIRNFIVSIGGVTLITVLVKIRSLLNILKRPDLENQVFEIGQRFISDVTQKPALVNELSTIIKNLPEFQNLVDKTETTRQELLLELEGRIFDIEAKIKSGLFTDEELTRLVEYKAKLIEHVKDYK